MYFILFSTTNITVYIILSHSQCEKFINRQRQSNSSIFPSQHLSQHLFQKSMLSITFCPSPGSDLSIRCFYTNSSIPYGSEQTPGFFCCSRTTTPHTQCWISCQKFPPSSSVRPPTGRSSRFSPQSSPQSRSWTVQSRAATATPPIPQMQHWHSALSVVPGYDPGPPALTGPDFQV